MLDSSSFFCERCKDFEKFAYDGNCDQSCPELWAWNPEDHVCVHCKDNDTYFQDDRCIGLCDPDRKVNVQDKVCESCFGNGVIYDGVCLDKCPDYTLKRKGFCLKCVPGQYFYEGKCLSNCFEPLVTDNLEGRDYCRECHVGTRYVNGTCFPYCTAHFYEIEVGKCRRCFCANDEDICHNDTNQCICADPVHTYGYSCEFYSQEDINEKKMTIVSLNNMAIKSNTTFFSYKIKGRYEKLDRKIYFFEWKFFGNFLLEIKK